MNTRQTSRPGTTVVQSAIRVAIVVGIAALNSISSVASMTSLEEPSATSGAIHFRMALVTLDRSEATRLNAAYGDVWQRGVSTRSSSAMLTIADQPITAGQLLEDEMPEGLASMIEVVTLGELAPTTNSTATIGVGRRVPYFEPLKNGDFRLKYSEKREGIAISIETGEIRADHSCEIASLSFEETRIIRRVPIYQVDLDAGYPVIEKTAAATYRAFTLSPDEAAIIGLTVLDDGREVFLIMTATAQE